MLTALGCRFPTSADAFHDLARTLNYDRQWPYLSVQMVLDEAQDP